MTFIFFLKSDLPSTLTRILKLHDPPFPFIHPVLLSSPATQIQLVNKPHSFLPLQDFFTHSLFAIAIDTALVQNLIISTLSFKLLSKTPVAKSFSDVKCLAELH